MTEPEFGQRLFPSEDEYSAAVDDVSAQFEDSGGIKLSLPRFIKQNIHQSHTMRQYIDYAKTLGNVVEPVDRLTGDYIDETTPTMDAIIKGSTVGLEIIKRVYKNRITVRQLVESTLTFHYDEDQDLLHKRHQLASQVVHLGEEGLRLFGATACDKLEDLEGQAISNIGSQVFFRRACGLVALNAQKIQLGLIMAEEKKDLEKFQQEADSIHDIDWDEDWERALGL